MNVEYINPFIEASQQVIQMMTGIKPTLGKVHLKNSPYPSDSVAVIVGLTGKLRGQVIISLNIETAMSIASIMMGGMPIEKFDDMPKSAISELGNMIWGILLPYCLQKGSALKLLPRHCLWVRKLRFHKVV